jgi:gluconolactonase
MIGAMSVLCDGTVTEPRLDHPEGVAVHPDDGSIWCGGERGQIYRIEPDGGGREVVASTDGFCLGLAFNHHAELFVCDLKHAAVFRLDTRRGDLERFADGVPGHRFRNPNWPAFDHLGRLYVSDSWSPAEPGPGIVRLNPDGTGELWHAGPFRFANGIAFDADCRRLYVAETHRSTVSAVPLLEGGDAGAARDVVELTGVLPDGLAVASDGSLVVACYEPSRILRVHADGEVSVVADDPTAHTLCHPTNVAFAGDALIRANLGRWHLTRIEVGLRGLPLPPARREATGR